MSWTNTLRQRSLRVVAALLFAALVIGGAAAQDVERIEQPSVAAGADELTTPNASATPSKLGDLLQIIALEQTNQLDSSSAYDRSMAASVVADDYVVIDATAESDPHLLRNQLLSIGMQGGEVAGLMVGGRLPVSAVPALEGLSALRFARVSPFLVNAGSTVTQGDIALRADRVRDLFGVDGTGLDVGVISNSYNCIQQLEDAVAGDDPNLITAADDIASGDLPSGAGRITILFDQGQTGRLPCPSNPSNYPDVTDEGRAMMQLIHDIAPGADLLFHEAFSFGQSGLANAYRALRDAGADIIVDDVSFVLEAYFQDGPVAQAVDEVVGDGVVVFSSAGNAADQALEVTGWPSVEVFNFGGNTYDLLEDPNNPGNTLVHLVTVPAFSQMRVIVQWDDPHFSISGVPGADTDIDVFNVNPLDFSDNPTFYGADQRGGDPAFLAGINNLSGSTPRMEGIIYAKQRNTPADPDPGLTRIFFPDFLPDNETGGAPTIFGHANSALGAGVAAAFYDHTPAFGTSPPVAEAFTALGGTTILYDTSGNPISDNRQQPLFTSTNGGNTTFFGSWDFEPDGFNNFFGTSAAAPEAAAVTALLLEAEPTLTPAQVYNRLNTTAIDMGAPGYDLLTGHGLIQATAIFCTQYDPDLESTGYVVGTVDTNLVDDLRKAVACAETDADLDTILISSGDTIVFTDTDATTTESALQDLNFPLFIGTTGAGTGTLQGSGTTANDFALVEISAGNTGVTLHNLTIEDFEQLGVDGGAIRNQGSLTLDGVTLDDNSTDGNGGAVANSGGTLTISNGTTITNNSAVNGGGILNDAGTLTITDSAIGIMGDGNTASSDGGGIENRNAGATVTITNSTITDNTATNNDGGGIFTEQSLNITGGSVTLNDASSVGGGLRITSSAIVTLTNVNVDENTANAGGGIQSDGDLTIMGGTISNNVATGSVSGGLDAGGNTLLDGVTVDGNEALGSVGGGITAYADLTIVNSTLSNNRSDGSGGAVNVQTGTSNVRINNSTLTGNNTVNGDGSGGGVANFGSLTITNSTLSGNGNESGGGGALQILSPATVVNSVISGNVGNQGGGITVLSSTSLTLINSTIADNYGTLTANGGGIFVGSNATLNLDNSIVFGNEDDGNGSISDEMVVASSGTAIVRDSLIDATQVSGTGVFNIADPGNITGAVDPLFTAPVGASSTPNSGGDYTLQSGSPAIEQGENTQVPNEDAANVNVDVDQDGTIENSPISIDRTGNSRFRGASVDMGAFEAPAALCASYDPALAGAGYTIGTANANLTLDLRQAVTCANADVDADTILLQGQVVSFADEDPSTNGAVLPTIINPLTIVGGAGQIDYSGSGSVRLLNVADNAGAVAIQDATLSGGDSDLGGALRNENSDGTTLNNMTITNNSASLGGGGIANLGNGVLTIIGGNITNNNATATSTNVFGGGILNTGSLSLTNSVGVNGNTAQTDSGIAYGGGLYNTGSLTATPPISFISNSATATSGGLGFGGNIANVGGTVTLPDGTSVTSGSATTAGGNIANLSSSVGVGDMAVDAIIQGGVAGYGAGIYNEAFGSQISTLAVTGSSINNNDVNTGGFGGGILNFGGAVTVTNTTISDNDGDLYGGGFLSYFGTFDMTGGSLNNNTAQLGGGGFSGPNSSFGTDGVTIDGTVINGNTATDLAGNFGNGAGIWSGLFNAFTDIRNSQIYSNNAQSGTDGNLGRGGGLYVTLGGVLAGDNLLLGTNSGFSASVGNTADTGGGIYVSAGNNTLDRLAAELLEMPLSNGLSAASALDAAALDGLSATTGPARATITDSLIVANSAERGGGVYVDSPGNGTNEEPGLILRNNTVYINTVAENAATTTLTAGGPGIEVAGNGTINLEYTTAISHTPNDLLVTGASADARLFHSLLINCDSTGSTLATVVGSYTALASPNCDPSIQDGNLTFGATIVSGGTLVAPFGNETTAALDNYAPDAVSGQCYVDYNGNDSRSSNEPLVPLDQRGGTRPVNGISALRCDAGAFEDQTTGAGVSSIDVIGFDAVPDHIRDGQTSVQIALTVTGTPSEPMQVLYSPDAVCSSDDLVVGSLPAPSAGNHTLTLDVTIPRAVLQHNAQAADPASQPTGTTSQDVGYLCAATSSALDGNSSIDAVSGKLITADDITYFPYDVDGNGVVTATDAVGAVQALGGDDMRYDHDGNGVVTPSEVLNTLLRMGYLRNTGVIEAERGQGAN